MKSALLQCQTRDGFLKYYPLSVNITYEPVYKRLNVCRLLPFALKIRDKLLFLLYILLMRITINICHCCLAS